MSDRPTLNKAERAIADRLSDEIDRFNMETTGIHDFREWGGLDQNIYVARLP
jgi:hypothetical protein